MLKPEQTNVGELNDVAMTHFKKTRINIAAVDGRTIQCHKIGGHWVTSTSEHGTVIMYESLSTGLNKTLLQLAGAHIRGCRGVSHPPPQLFTIGQKSVSKNVYQKIPVRSPNVRYTRYIYLCNYKKLKFFIVSYGTGG